MTKYVGEFIYVDTFSISDLVMSCFREILNLFIYLPNTFGFWWETATFCLLPNAQWNIKTILTYKHQYITSDIGWIIYSYTRGYQVEDIFT